MLLPNRHGPTDSHRYGFQGQEKDDEIKGEGKSLNYKFRMHDPRIGRFFAEDPMVHAYPWYSPYQFSGNTPIMSIELEGLEPIVWGGVLVGYNVMAGQGPTQIAADINNSFTQYVYGYTVQESVSWKKVVSDNVDYYSSVGDWNNTDMFDVNNKVWNNLNSEKGDYLLFPDNIATLFTVKPLNLDYEGRWGSPATGGFSESESSLSRFMSLLTPKAGYSFSDGGFSKKSIVTGGPGKRKIYLGNIDFDGAFFAVTTTLSSGSDPKKGLGPDGKTPLARHITHSGALL